MPTYEYQCRKCKHKFDAFQQMTEKPLENCPVCQGSLQRLISAGAGFIFKGSGFYATDYRSKEYQEKRRAETKPSACPSPGKKESCKSCPLDKNGQ